MPEYSKETDIAIKLSCFFSMAQWWLFRGMWFIPYLFRAFRLHQIWEIHNKFYLKETEAGLRIFGESDRYTAEQETAREKKRCFKSTYFIRERNLLKWYLISISPFIILIILALIDKNIVDSMPSFGMMQCGNYNTSEQYYTS